MNRSSSGRWTGGLAGALLVASMPSTGAWPAVADTGEVLTVGGDYFGQRGNGTAGGGSEPGVVLGAASDVAGGREHVLALVGGAVYAWGSDLKGQVGDGGSYLNRTAPWQIATAGNSPVTAVTAGHYHSMALRADGTVAAWGWNSKGQIGPAGGSGLKVPAPVTVTGLTNVQMIAAGRAHSIALDLAGTVWTWGDDTFGQLGDGAAGTGRNPLPRQVSLPAAAGAVTFIAGGRDTTYAITTAGELYAWGNNQYGQVGNGQSGTTPVLSPVKVLSNVVQVESGADHAVALLADGTVYSWGRNRYGQLGYSGGTQLTPRRVAAVPLGVDKVYVGRDHSIALVYDTGKTYVWGRNDAGQLGLPPTTAARPNPTEIPSLAGAVDAGGGQQYTVILR